MPSLRHIAHLFRISRVLAKHDALFFLDDLHVKPFVVLLAKNTAILKRREGRPGERMARALHELGPTFIKLGQALSIRADLIGDELADDLSQLQDRLPSFSFAQAKATIERELGRPLAAVFRGFDEEPVAAASIAQVHFAIDGEGREVAVKVLRPGVEQAFRREIDLLYGIAETLDRFIPKLKRLKLIEVVRNFERTVNVEMDLRLEAAAASEMAENFAGDDMLKIPAIDWSRTSQRVLTLERIQGVSAGDTEALKAAGCDLDRVMRNISCVFFKQVYRDGFFHADMHPGNLFVVEGDRLALVDFGIMGRLEKPTRLYLAEMLFGFLSRDYARVSRVHFQAGYVPSDQDEALFAQACRSIGEPVFDKKQSEISIARLLRQMFKVTEDFKMETQPQLILLQKSMMLAEGIGRSLNPEVNFWEMAKPLMEEWAREHMGPKGKARMVKNEIAKTPERMQSLGEVLDKLPEIIGHRGLKLHPDTLELFFVLQKRKRAGRIAYWKIILLSVITSLIAAALFNATVR